MKKMRKSVAPGISVCCVLEMAGTRRVKCSGACAALARVDFLAKQTGLFIRETRRKEGVEHFFSIFSFDQHRRLFSRECFWLELRPENHFSSLVFRSVEVFFRNGKPLWPFCRLVKPWTLLPVADHVHKNSNMALQHCKEKKAMCSQSCIFAARLLKSMIDCNISSVKSPGDVFQPLPQSSVVGGEAF